MSKKDHVDYMMKKEARTLKLYEEQMIQGKIFDKSAFEKISELKESFSDFEEPMPIKTNAKSSKNTETTKDESTQSNDIPSEELDYHD